MATLSAPAKYVATTVTLQCGPHTVTHEGLRHVQAGFTECLPWCARTERPLPALSEGHTLPVSVSVRQESTEPPPALREHELIALMDRHHIGTDASLATHIETIQQRAYVEVEAGTRGLRATPLGAAYIRALKAVDEELCAPQLRGTIEGKLDQVAEGVAD